MAPHASLLLFLIPTLGFATATPFQIPPSHWKRGGDVAVGNKWAGLRPKGDAGGDCRDLSQSDTIFVKLDEGGAVTNPILSYDAGVPLVPSVNGVDGALTPPIISWTRLPQLAQEQLNGIQYEHTMVPFNDANFQGTLDAAFNDAFFHDVPLEVDGRGQQDPTEADIDPDVGVPIPSSTPAPDPSA
ncbi:necrosis inducing protein [Colletotrichum kahawae]|uniref:Necrosis inducing protein n=1 Tax=Colletotrichum kahawae TaxID=34407 RepID=A0AAE0DE35_COLKA|nr:necrosis inducing protein [Colletotrichum kahawae]